MKRSAPVILSLAFLLPVAASAMPITPSSYVEEVACELHYSLDPHFVHRGQNYPHCPVGMRMRNPVCITSHPFSCRWTCIPIDPEECFDATTMGHEQYYAGEIN